MSSCSQQSRRTCGAWPRNCVLPRRQGSWHTRKKGLAAETSRRSGGMRSVEPKEARSAPQTPSFSTESAALSQLVIRHVRKQSLDLTHLIRLGAAGVATPTLMPTAAYVSDAG